jgi:hypothetical protein
MFLLIKARKTNYNDLVKDLILLGADTRIVNKKGATYDKMSN